MKTNLLSILLLTITLSLAYAANAQEPRYKKQKSYSKSYAVSPSDRINLDNQFGEMKLIAWDKNEVKVDVSITGMSNDEDRAQEIVNRISIQDEKSGGNVTFKTKIADDKKQSKTDKNKYVNEGMKINYTVYLPTRNPLNAKNQFGPMIVPDYRGEVTLESQFGSLTTGKLSNAKKVIVQFGKADIESVSNGVLDIRYTSATINPSGNVDATLQFSTVKLNLDNDIKSLDVNNSYSEVYLDLNKNLSASYDINTSFGSFTNKSNFSIAGEGKSSGNSKSFSGKSGSGSAKININSSFGSVTAGHDLKVDMNKKKKTS